VCYGGGTTKQCICLRRGGGIELDRVVRRDKLSGSQAEVHCPRVLKDYQTLMGSADVHDQLRLQRQVLLSCTYKLPTILIVYVHV
jgi:hypothetical protein